MPVSNFRALLTWRAWSRPMLWFFRLFRSRTSRPSPIPRRSRSPFRFSWRMARLKRITIRLWIVDKLFRWLNGKLNWLIEVYHFVKKWLISKRGKIWAYFWSNGKPSLYSVRSIVKLTHAVNARWFVYWTWWLRSFDILSRLTLFGGCIFVE